MTVIGIDPGKTGAMAAIHSDGNIAVSVFFIAGKELDIVKISNWLYKQATKEDKVIACIEKVHAMRRRPSGGGEARVQGVTSTFTFGKNVGILYGILGTLEIPLYEVSPQSWKKLILADTAKDKQAAIDYCIKAYPNVSLLATPRSKKPHDGMADSICIARYALEKFRHLL